MHRAEGSLKHPRGRLVCIEQTPLPLSAGFLPRSPSAFFPDPAAFLRSPASRVGAQMLPKRRRVRAGSPHSAVASSTPPAARFPGVAIYLAEPRMGRSRRAFLTRLARSKGFRILDVYRCAAPARAGRWRDASPPGAGVIMPVTLVCGLNCGPGRELARSCCDSKQHLRLWVPSQP